MESVAVLWVLKEWLEISRPCTYTDYMISTGSRLQSEFTANLSRVALDYIRLGLHEFHYRRRLEFGSFQAAMGNLCVGVELLLKSFIASGNITLVFRDMPQELRALLVCKGEPSPKVDMTPHAMDLVSGKFKTIDFNQTVSLFFAFKPNLKGAHHAHLKHLSLFRNKSLHGLYPSFEVYAVERAAFTAIDLVSALRESGELDLRFVALEKDDHVFHSQFPADRINRVKKALEEATVRAKAKPDGQSYVDAQGWEEYAGVCPVCHEEILLEGYTEPVIEEAAEGGFCEFLFFEAESFECTNCGLNLLDSDELRLAGVERSYDRSSEFNQWYAEHILRI